MNNLNIENIDTKQIIEKLNTMLKPKRLEHSINVAKCAIKLSEIYGYDKEKAYLAGLVHDCAKYFTKEQIDSYVEKYNIELDPLEVDNIALSHSIIGSFAIQDVFNIQDMDIINAVRYHTTGRENMSTLEKIIFLADYIEPKRDFPQAKQAREIAKVNLDKAMFYVLDENIKNLIELKNYIALDTIKARNYYLEKNE